MGAAAFSLCIAFNLNMTDGDCFLLSCASNETDLRKGKSQKYCDPLAKLEYNLTALERLYPFIEMNKR